MLNCMAECLFTVHRGRQMYSWEDARYVIILMQISECVSNCAASGAICLQDPYPPRKL